MTTSGETPRRQRAFHFDQRGCIACHACDMACKDLHDLPVGVSWRRVTTLELGRYPRPEVCHLTVSCNHCERPACADACPSGALAKRAVDGVVTLDQSLCTGCRACEEACPYGAIQYDESSQRVAKCDLCLDLLARGEQPACVAACVMRVLTVGWLDEMAEPPPRLRGLPDPDLTGPALRVVPHRDGKVPS